VPFTMKLSSLTPPVWLDDTDGSSQFAVAAFPSALGNGPCDGTASSIS